MTELSEETFTRLAVQTVESLGYEVLLNNPDTDATYPCIVCNNTYKTIAITEDKIPVRTRFQISFEAWATSKYDTMAIMDSITVKLRELNFTPTGYPIELYDEITSKHRRLQSYEVYYSGLFNTFDRTK